MLLKKHRWAFFHSIANKQEVHGSLLQFVQTTENSVFLPAVPRKSEEFSPVEADQGKP